MMRKFRLQGLLLILELKVEHNPKKIWDISRQPFSFMFRHGNVDWRRTGSYWSLLGHAWNTFAGNGTTFNFNYLRQVILNGRILGLHHQPEEFTRKFRMLRRSGKNFICSRKYIFTHTHSFTNFPSGNIPVFVSVYCNEVVHDCLGCHQQGLTVPNIST